MSNVDEGPLFPAEIELARAVDRIIQRPWEVTDWPMVLAEYERLQQHGTAIIYNALQQNKVTA